MPGFADDSMWDKVELDMRVRRFAVSGCSSEARETSASGTNDASVCCTSETRCSGAREISASGITGASASGLRHASVPSECRRRVDFGINVSSTGLVVRLLAPVALARRVHE